MFVLFVFTYILVILYREINTLACVDVVGTSARSVDQAPHYDGICGIIGIVFFDWALNGVNDVVNDSAVESWQSKLNRKHRRNNIGGFLHYTSSSVYTRGNGVFALHADDLQNDSTLSSTWYLQQRRSKFNGKRLEQHLQESEIAAPSHTFVVSRQLAELLVKKA